MEVLVNQAGKDGGLNEGSNSRNKMVVEMGIDKEE